MPDAQAEDKQAAGTAPAPHKKWLSFTLGFVALTVLFGLNIFLNNQNGDLREVNRQLLEQRPPEWLENAAIRAQEWDFEEVYVCKPEQADVTLEPSELVPCPDYTARVEFHGNNKDTPPTLYPAKNAKGQVVIGLKARWLPTDCPAVENCFASRWVIEPAFADSVVGFAYNAYNEQTKHEFGFIRFYQGIRFFRPSRAEYGPISLGNDGLEIYAADEDPNVISPPLDNNQLRQR